MADNKIGLADLTRQDIDAFLRRDPRLSQVYTPLQNLQEPLPPWRSGLNEAAAAYGPWGLASIQRALGYDLSPMLRINEGHGIANRPDLQIRWK